MDDKFKLDWLVAADLLEEHGFDHIANHMRQISVGKVYVVSSGSYSDWSVEGLFLRREDAEAFHAERLEAEGWIARDTNDIEEWNLDDKNGQVLRRYWNASIGPNGVLGAGSGEHIFEEMTDCKDRSRVIEYDAQRRVVVHSYVSQDHANKVAVEQWQQRLRDGTWTHEPVPEPKPAPEPVRRARVRHPTQAFRQFQEICDRIDTEKGDRDESADT